MSHNCSAILIHCMDFRLTDEIYRWLKDNHLNGDCDIVSVAGAGKPLLDDSERNYLLSQIEASIKLHNSDTVILLHHSSCGAYKLEYNFSSVEEEKNKQKEDMDKVEEIILKKFKDLKVKKVWMELQDNKGEKIKFVQK